MASFTASPANWTNSSDANFRAWGSYIAAQLLAVGHVQTADTGQINWATVTAPAGVNTFQGYEIWRFNDALQATAPVYIKIEYGEGASADAPCVRVQFGSGSNGSGTLTGNLSGQYLGCGTATAGACSVFGSGSTNRFVGCFGFAAAGLGQWFGWERSVDVNGDPTAEAVLFLGTTSSPTASGVNTKMTVVWSTTLGVLAATTAGAVPAIFPQGATMATGTQTAVAPVLHNKGVFMNPGLNFVGYFTENISAGSSVSVTMYGTAHTYYALPTTAAVNSTGFQGPGGGTESLAIRYE